MVQSYRKMSSRNVIVLTLLRICYLDKLESKMFLGDIFRNLNRTELKLTVLLIWRIERKKVKI